jgi:hypothetical protein
MAHKVGQPVQYFQSDDVNEEPMAATITEVHDDGTACLAYWCTMAHEWKEAHNVAHSGAGTDGAYFVCLDEVDQNEPEDV